MSVDIRVPTLGESVTEATVAKWFKKEGDAVAADEAIVELETDKVTVEVYAPVAGVVSEIIVKEGNNIEVNGLLGKVTEGAAGAKPSEKKANTPAPAPAAKAAEPTKTTSDTSQPPATRRVLAENNLSAKDINGSGKDGRITKSDVLNTLEKPATTAVAAPFPYGKPNAPREERVRMSRLRQRIAERLKEAQNTAAMLTTFNEVDMTNVMALRKQYNEAFQGKHGIKMGFMGFFVKAAIQALQEIPAVNGQIDGQDIIYKNYYDIGVAVGTDAGLVVPVVRDADALSLAGVEKAIAALADKARSGKLSMDDMSGGTFTITNGGVYGSLMSTPILNAPQSGILGLHKIQDRPMVVKGEVKVRPMMYIALSYDHRIIDGKEAVHFLVRVKEAIEDPQRLLLAV